MHGHIASAVIGCLLLSGCMSLESRLQSEDYETRKEAEIELYCQACETHDAKQIWQAVERITCDEVLAMIAARMTTDADILKATRRMRQSSWIAAFILDCPSDSVAMDLVARLDQKDITKVYKCTKSKRLKVACLNSLQEISLQQLPYDQLMASEITNVTNLAVFRKVVENGYSTLDDAHQKHILKVLIARAQDDKNVQASIARAYKQSFPSLSESDRTIMCRAISDAELIKELISEAAAKRKSEQFEKDREESIRSLRAMLEEQRYSRDTKLSRARKREEGWHFSEARKYRESAAEHEQNIKKLEKELAETEHSACICLYLENTEARKFFIKNISLANKIKMARDNLGSIVMGTDYFWRRRIFGLHDCVGNEEKVTCFSEILSTIDDEKVAVELADELFNRYEEAGVEQSDLRNLANGNLDALFLEDNSHDIVDNALVWWEDEEVELFNKSFMLLRENDAVRKALLNRVQKKIDLVNKALPIAEKKHHPSVSKKLVRNRNMLESLKHSLEG